MKFIVDMNLSESWVAFLADNGISAVHWSSIGTANAQDRQIMAHATQHDCCVLTNDLDFGIILAISRVARPSVVQIRADVLQPDVIGSTVLAALRSAWLELEAGALLTIDPKRTRLRVLPF